MNNLIGMNLEELKAIAKSIGLKPFVGNQIADWIYNKKIDDINLMTNISLEARERLSENYKIEKIPFIKVDISKDGTKKYLYDYGNNAFIETVMIPDNDRVTLCVSTQAGCKMNCKFCATGHQGFNRNLTKAEILNQILTLPELNSLTNIVYMGMGEPFDNYDNVLGSINILTSKWGLALSPRRITVSTSGVISGIKSFLQDTQAHLAISLHSPFHSERAEIMPIENSNNIEDIISLLSSYDWSGQRRVSFEYILWKGLNDSPSHIREISRLLSNIKSRVNLIKFHTIEGTPFISADDKTMEDFRDALNSKGIITTIRTSKGEDILAACGLLSTKNIQSQE